METKKSILQMLELLLARQEARQERGNAELKADIIAKIEAGHERFLAILDGWTSYGKGTTTCQTETMSCPEEMDATRLVNPEATEAAVERQELFKEEINIDNIGSLEDRCEDRRLIVRRRLGAKKRIQDSAGSWQKLSAARKRVLCRAIPAVRKRNICEGPGKDGSAGEPLMEEGSRRHTGSARNAISAFATEAQRTSYACG
jgi:hypothetical protein